MFLGGDFIVEFSVIKDFYAPGTTLAKGLKGTQAGPKRLTLKC